MTTLTDKDILAAMQQGDLIRNGVVSQLGPSCYELRASPIYYDLTEGDRRIDAGQQRTVIIKPGHRVVLISIEEVVVPANIIARIASKGSLFSVGLAPLSTYADPGFSGNVGLVTQNVSDKYIVLPVGEPIAKVDFSLLTGKVDHPYRGQHGFQTRIWPIRHELQRSHDEVKSDPRVRTEREEADQIIPGAVAASIRRLTKIQRIVNYGLIGALLVNAAMFGLITTKIADTWIGFITNLASSALVALLTYFAQKRQ